MLILSKADSERQPIPTYGHVCATSTLCCHDSMTSLTPIIRSIAHPATSGPQQIDCQLCRVILSRKSLLQQPTSVCKGSKGQSPASRANSAPCQQLHLEYARHQVHKTDKKCFYCQADTSKSFERQAVYCSVGCVKTNCLFCPGLSSHYLTIKFIAW